jgi:hypothetical protein
MTPPLQVHVVHGGLDYARFPLLVGHHLHEGLSGTGRRVNAKLGGQLQCSIDLKLFVGALRTAQYLRPNNHDDTAPAYAGAVVLGLGAIGELTPGNLAETVTRGVLRYAFEHVHRDPFAPPQGEPCALRLSSVLLGTQLHALMTGDAVAALLQGVWRAAQLLARVSDAGRQASLVELEIIEIDEAKALDAAYELQRLLRRPEWKDRFHWKSGILETREGCTSGYRRQVGPSTWQRLIVRQEPDGGLSFVLIGGQARVEATQVQSDVASLRHLIDRLSDDSAAPGDAIQRGSDPLLGSVLFQLLLPHALQARMTNLDNTVLVVDDASAAYPWELLVPPATLLDEGDSTRPIAVQAGFVRQRASTDFRQLPRLHTGLNALVIGAPETGGWVDSAGRPVAFNDLPGARKEALAVHDRLRAAGWSVEPWISPDPASKPAANHPRRVTFEQVRVALLKAPCRVLHLSGHGAVDQWIRRTGTGGDARELHKTGVVLSNQEILGAVDVESMSLAPEFVFLNCCYSGRTGAGLASGRGQRAALAASLALKFIDMGSRAVIATGWQIDDDAALAFAEHFYDSLLQGRPFGEAVRMARRFLYEAPDQPGGRADHNTWGAFQCYGDPHWRLNAGDAAARGTACLRDAERTVSPGELAARVAQVQAIAGDEPPDVVTAQLDRLLQALQVDPHRQAWLGDSRVATEAGLAYRALGEHEKAAALLQRAARGIGSQMRIGDIDTLVDTLVRVGGDSAVPATRAAHALLQQLDALGASDEARWPLPAEPGPQSPTCRSERDALRGAMALRAAHAHVVARPETEQPDATAADLLAQAARHYACAWRAKHAESDALDRRAHALSGALLAAALLALLDTATPGAGPAGAQAALQAPAGVGEGAAQARPGDGERAAQASPGDGAGAPPTPVGDGKGTPQTPVEWRAAAADLLEQLVRDSGQRATFWQHAKAIELRTAAGLYAHAMRDDGYRVEHVQQDMDSVGREIGRLMHLWPSPLQLEGTCFRFDLIHEVVRRIWRDDTMASEVDALAMQALELLKEPTRREIG